MFQILNGLEGSERTQVISISGESGSGKTETNKQALRAISYCSSRVMSMRQEKTTNMESRILKCDPILEVFGNAKTIKNDNSSRFGKLISLRFGASLPRVLPLRDAVLLNDCAGGAGGGDGTGSAMPPLSQHSSHG